MVFWFVDALIFVIWHSHTHQKSNQQTEFTFRAQLAFQTFSLDDHHRDMNSLLNMLSFYVLRCVLFKSFNRISVIVCFRSFGEVSGTRSHSNWWLNLMLPEGGRRICHPCNSSNLHITLKRKACRICRPNNIIKRLLVTSIVPGAFKEHAWGAKTI